MSNARMPKASASDTQLNAGAIDGLVAQLRAHGFCQVEGMETPEAIADLLRGFGPLVWHRDSDATGVTFLSRSRSTESAWRRISVPMPSITDRLPDRPSLLR